MGNLAIRSLRPTVSRKEALRAFGFPGFTALYWRMRSGPMQRIADAYVPFWLYRVRYELGRTSQTRLFALDAVDGSLDLFEFSRSGRNDLRRFWPPAEGARHSFRRHRQRRQ